MTGHMALKRQHFPLHPRNHGSKQSQLQFGFMFDFKH